MGKLYTLFSVFLLSTLIVQAQAIFSCDQYRIRLNSISYCNGSSNSIITLNNVTIILDGQCILKVKACVTSSKGFTSGKGTFSMQTKGFKPEISFDLCQEGVGCPFQPGSKCILHKTDISDLKNLLPLLQGDATGIVNITHNTGQTCIKGQGALTRIP